MLFRSAGTGAGFPRWTVADLRGVGHVHPPARRVLDTAVAELRGAGCPTVLVEAGPGPRVPRAHAAAESDDVDRALAWCEDALLTHLRSTAPVATSLASPT